MIQHQTTFLLGRPLGRRGFAVLAAICAACMACAAILSTSRSIAVSSEDESLSKKDMEAMALLCKRAGSPIRRVPFFIRHREWALARRTLRNSIKEQRFYITKRVVGDYYIVRQYTRSEPAPYGSEEETMLVHVALTNNNWRLIHGF